MNTLEDFIKIANDLADIARSISMKFFRQDFDMVLKESLSPLVTQADLEIEKSLREYLFNKFPNHGILGEEYENQQTQSEYLWVIDPIDGTSAFSCGKPTFSTLIALLQNGVPIIGIIEQAFLRERWLGVTGRRTTFNGENCNVGEVSKSGIVRMNCTTPFMFNETQWLKFIKLKQIGTTTSFGGDGYAYGLLANGYIDIIMEADLKIYDIAPMIPIITNAGGIITDWQGNEILFETFKGTVLATRNKELHNKALRIINDN